MVGHMLTQLPCRLLSESGRQRNGNLGNQRLFLCLQGGQLPYGRRVRIRPCAVFDLFGLLIERAHLCREFIRGFDQLVRGRSVEADALRPGARPGLLEFGSLARGDSPKDERVSDVIGD